MTLAACDFCVLAQVFGQLLLWPCVALAACSGKPCIGGHLLGCVRIGVTVGAIGYPGAMRFVVTVCALGHQRIIIPFFRIERMENRMALLAIKLMLDTALLDIIVIGRVTLTALGNGKRLRCSAVKLGSSRNFDLEFTLAGCSE